MALLGWGSADDETIISTGELVEQFSIERVSRNPARFDHKKLRWLNGRYVRELSVDELTARLEDVHRAQRPARRRRDLAREDADAGGLLAAGRVRLRRARRRSGGAREVAGRGWPRGAARGARGARGAASRSRSTPSQEALEGVVAALDVKPKQVFQPIRVALAGRAISPGIFETLVVLGREESLRRIDAALAA